MNPNQLKAIVAVIVGLAAPYITGIPFFEGRPDVLQFVLEGLQAVTLAAVVTVVGWVSNTQWGEQFNRIVLAVVRHVEESSRAGSKLQLRNLAIEIIKREVFETATGSWWRRLILKLPIIGNLIVGSAVDKAASGLKNAVSANSGSVAIDIARIKNRAA